MVPIVTQPVPLLSRLRWRRRWRQSPVLFQLAADVVTLAAATLLYLWVRFVSGWFDSVAVPTGWEVGSIVGVLTSYWLFLFWLSGLYRDWYSRPPVEELGVVLRTVLIGIAILVVLVLGDSGEFYRSNFRAVAALYAGVLVFGVGAGRVVARAFQRYLRHNGIIRIPTLVVGNAHGVERLFAELQRMPHWGYHPVGIVAVDAQMVHGFPAPVVGTTRELSQLLRRYLPEEVLLAFHPPEPDELWRVVGVLSGTGVGIKILPELYHAAMGQARIQRLYGTRLLEVNPELLRPWQAFVKRAVDVVISLFVLVGGAPFWLLIALAILVDSGPPILFVQERV
ncbi:MAG: sugar transferase, partial [Candidatus Kapabacteria bacterium]|nr:sugar transferase [Candidatus Kapabacteria bacterium]